LTWLQNLKTEHRQARCAEQGPIEIGPD
jgi:hypothetical protein